MMGAVVEEEAAVAREAAVPEAEVVAPEVVAPEAVALEVAVPEVVAQVAVVAEAREVAEAPIYRQPRSAMSTTRSKVGIIPSLSALPAGYCRMIAILKGDD
jgi:hypothetical protein